jgi:hypothetical protein
MNYHILRIIQRQKKYGEDGTHAGLLLAAAAPWRAVTAVTGKRAA